MNESMNVTPTDAAVIQTTITNILHHLLTPHLTRDTMSSGSRDPSAAEPPSA